MTQLSKFQIACEREVHKVLHAFGRDLKGRCIEQVVGFPEGELSVSGTISDTETKIFIYDDGAEFFDGKKVDVRFEQPDFDTLDQLRDAYIAALSEYLSDLTGVSPKNRWEFRVMPQAGFLARFWSFLSGRHDH